jgi:putative transposase
MVDVIFSKNCVYVVWCPKYSHKIIIGSVAIAIEKMLKDLCNENRWAIVTKEIQPDHIHLLLCIPPAISVANVVKILKGTTARKLFLQFPTLKQKL